MSCAFQPFHTPGIDGADIRGSQDCQQLQSLGRLNDCGKFSIVLRSESDRDCATLDMTR